MKKQDEIIEIAKKWYTKLPFSEKYNEAFENLLKNPPELVDENITLYMKQNLLEQPEKTFIMFLYLCEKLQEQYEEKGIPQEILIASVSDLVLLTDAYYERMGMLGVENPDWMGLTLSFKLFRIGRLQFAFYGAEQDDIELGLQKNEPVIDVHIPRGQNLQEDEVKNSFQQANAFFKQYFPEYQYRFYACHSWMFDEAIVPFLKPDSNILKFSKLFTPVSGDVMDSALYFVFGKGVSRQNLKNYEAKSSLAKQLKEYALSGGVLKNVFAVRRIDEEFK